MISRILDINSRRNLQNYNKNILNTFIIKFLKMQASSIPDFDIQQFKSVMTQDPTQENGWTLQYEGSVDKEFKGIS